MMPRATMKNIHKKGEVYLIVIFSFWFMVFPAFLYFSILDNSDLPSVVVSFKSIDEEDSISNPDNRQKILYPSVLRKDSPIVHLSLSWTPDLPDQLPAFHSESLVLRC
jgi:hypothetical protein